MLFLPTSCASQLSNFYYVHGHVHENTYNVRGRRDHDRTVDEFITTYAIRAYHN